jgi:hypothetical protein
MGNDQSRADIFYGGWQQGELVLHVSAISEEAARLVMFATTVASCRDHPEQMYAISSDQDGFVAVALRSGDGGASWDTFQPELNGSANQFRDKAGNQGNDSRPCNDIAVAPTEPATVAVVWRTGGIFLSTDSGGSWTPAMRDPHVHSDLHRVRFDPVPLENRILVVTCGSPWCQAAREYSLIRPPRTGFRWIGPRSRSATVRWPPSCSLSGTRWAMPWCGRAVL